MPVGQVKMKRYKNASELYDVFYKERKEDIAFYSRLLTEYKSRLDNNRVISAPAPGGFCCRLPRSILILNFMRLT